MTTDLSRVLAALCRAHGASDVGSALAISGDDLIAAVSDAHVSSHLRAHVRARIEDLPPRFDATLTGLAARRRSP